MNVNCYLPDDLGERAKDADVGLSSLLKEAVLRELARIDSEASSKVPGVEGAYVRSRRLKSPSIQIQLNAATNARGNGVGLAPRDRIPDAESGPRMLMLSADALRKLLAAIEDPS